VTHGVEDCDDTGRWMVDRKRTIEEAVLQAAQSSAPFEEIAG
jgi:hypothetical protein